MSYAVKGLGETYKISTDSVILRDIEVNVPVSTVARDAMAAAVSYATQNFDFMTRKMYASLADNFPALLDKIMPQIEQRVDEKFEAQKRTLIKGGLIAAGVAGAVLVGVRYYRKRQKK